MKRWLVNMRAGVVELADLQEPTAVNDEYVGNYLREIAFVRAADELGAWVRAQQLLEKEQTNEVP